MISLIESWLLNNRTLITDDIEELTVLELLGKYGTKINEIIPQLNLVPTKDEITNSRKLSETGNFTGTWNGLEVHQSDLGLSADWNEAKGTFSTVKARLDDVDTHVGNLENLTKYKKFKPDFAMFMDLIPGGIAERTHAEMDAQLDKMTDIGVSSLIIQPWVKWDGTSLTLWNTISNLTYLAQSAHAKGFKIACLKIHFYGLNGASFSALDQTHKDIVTTNYPAIVTSILNAFSGIEVDYVVVLNECYPLYNASTAYTTWTNTLINTAKSYGYKVGISTMGAKESLTMESSIRNNVDAFFINFYPRISFKREKTTHADAVNAIMGSYEVKCIRQINETHTTKDIYISETGCNDFWVALVNAGDSSLGWSFQPETQTGGLASSTMLYGLLNMDRDFQEIIKGVWWLYEQAIYYDICGDMIKKYTGGVA